MTGELHWESKIYLFACKHQPLLRPLVIQPKSDQAINRPKVTPQTAFQSIEGIMVDNIHL